MGPCLVVMLLFLVVVVMMLLLLVVIMLCRKRPLATKDSVHKGASADVAQDGKVVDLFGLPAFFDAVVDEGDQARRHNDADYQMMGQY